MWGRMGNNLTAAKMLATLLGGKLAVSRKLVDVKMAPRKLQVGQSGQIVSPKLYIALGISGAQQHIVGLKNVETIISVNIDELAPLNYLANLVVIGDATSVVESLIKKLVQL